MDKGFSCEDHAHALGRIEACLDGVARRLERMDQRTASALGDHERRIRLLEGWRAMVLGVAAAVSFGVAIAKDWLVAQFGGLWS